MTPDSSPEFDKKIPEKSVDSHHETLWGTPQNPQTGLVPIVQEVVKFLRPVMGFWKGAKWPATIIVGALLVALAGGVTNFIRGFFGGGTP